MLKRLSGIAIFIVVQMTILLFVCGLFFYIYLYSTLPALTKLKDYNPPEETIAYSIEDYPIAVFAYERRQVVPYNWIPKKLIEAFIAGEDASFFKHRGIDIQGIIRAAIKNIKAGRIVQGGSTITQQVARTLLSRKKNFIRKAKEAILAMSLESHFTKNQILYLYLNQIYLGHGAYGVQEASRIYFDKNVWELDLSEMAVLAGLPQAPSVYSPFVNPEEAKKRRNYVLKRMLDVGFITKDEYEDAINEEIRVRGRREDYTEKVPYFAEYIRRKTKELFGEDRLYGGGLKIYTTSSIQLQLAAQRALKNGLIRLDRRQGYRGPLFKINLKDLDAFLRAYRRVYGNEYPSIGKQYIGVVTDVNDDKQIVKVRVGDYEGVIPTSDIRWARKPDPTVYWASVRINRPSEVLSPGDVILVRRVKRAKLFAEDAPWLNKMIPKEGILFSLDQEPVVEGALFSVNAKYGYIEAMVGGQNYMKTEYNRAYQACRQPGSSFKPIIYLTALKDYKMTQASVLLDAAIAIDSRQQKMRWTPKNYGNEYRGQIILREALVHSMNNPTIRLLQSMDINKVVENAYKLGITTELKKNLSLALGASCVTLYDLIKVYCVFNRLGKEVKLTAIRRIYSRDHEVIYDRTVLGDPLLNFKEQIAKGYYILNHPTKQLFGEKTVYLVHNMLEGVATYGTGAQASSLGVPVAGKTGTTNDYFDALFMGYTKDIVTGVWVGFDIPNKPLGVGETGSRAALPIWLEYMKKSIINRSQKEFYIPDGIVFEYVDKRSGFKVKNKDVWTVKAAFIEGTEPEQEEVGKDKVSPSELLIEDGEL